jgi:hypothetical protein
MKIKFIFYFIIISFKNTILSKDIIIFNLVKNEMKINDIDIYYEGKNYKKVNFILDTMSFYTILKKDNLNTKIYKEKEQIEKLKEIISKYSNSLSDRLNESQKFLQNYK